MLSLSQDDILFLEEKFQTLINEIKEEDMKFRETMKKHVVSLKLIHSEMIKKDYSLLTLNKNSIQSNDMHILCAYTWNKIIEIIGHPVIPVGDFVNLFTEDEKLNNGKTMLNLDQLVEPLKQSLNNHQLNQRKNTINKILIVLEEVKLLENTILSGKKFIHFRGLLRKTQLDKDVLKNTLDYLVKNGVILERRGTNRSRLFCLQDSNTGHLLTN